METQHEHRAFEPDNCPKCGTAQRRMGQMGNVPAAAVPERRTLPECIAAAVAADFPGVPHRHAAIAAEVTRYATTGEGNAFVARWTAEHIDGAR